MRSLTGPAVVVDELATKICKEGVAWKLKIATVAALEPLIDFFFLDAVRLDLYIAF